MIRLAFIVFLLTVVVGLPTVIRGAEYVSAGTASDVEFSIGVDTNGDNVDDCDSHGGATTCSLRVNQGFGVHVYLDRLPAAVAEYETLEFALRYEGISWIADKLWYQVGGRCPGDGEEGRPPEVGVARGCLSLLNPSARTGLVAAAFFDCGSDSIFTGGVTMTHGHERTRLATDEASYSESEGSSESLRITCGLTDWLGDINCDLLVNSLDARFVLIVTAGIASEFTCLQDGDVNRDGLIDALDAVLILQHDAGLIGNFPR